MFLYTKAMESHGQGLKNERKRGILRRGVEGVAGREWRWRIKRQIMHVP